MIRIINAKSLYSSIYEAVEICKAEQDQKIEIIVPDKLTLFMERFLFEKLNISCSFNIKVSSFNRFAKRNLEIAKEKQISKVGSIILVNKILNENAKLFKSLKNKNYSFSYAEEIFKTISQLKSSKITYEEMGSFSSKDIALENKIHDLKIVYENYEKEKAGKLDSADMFLASTLFVTSGREKTKIVFVGFDDFTAIEYGIIEQLAVSCEVTVVNMYSNGENKSLFNNEIYSQLKNIAYINQLPFEIKNSSVKNSHIKEFFEDNLFSLNDKKCVVENNIIQLFSANSIGDEIEFVARNIRKDILCGSRFSNSGVAVFDLSSNIEKIKKIFEKYEINYYIDSNLTLASSILYKFFASVFKYNLESYNLSHLIDIINSPFFKLEQNMKRNIINSLLSSNFKGFVNEKFNLDIEEETKLYFISFMKNLKFEDFKAETAIKLFKNLYENFNFEEIIDELNSQLDVESGIVLTKSKEIIFDLFDEIERLYDEISLQDLFEIFVNISSVVEINNLPLTIDAVKVVDAENCKEIFEDLYIVNCTKMNAPKLKYDCGIILDKEIEELNFSNKLSPTIAHINKLSKLRLFNLVNMFNTSLTITYFNLPSEVIFEIKNRLKVVADCFTIDMPILSEKPFAKYEILSNWDAIEFGCKDDSQNEELIKKVGEEESVIKNKDFSQISNENLNYFENFETISSSNLENYFKCPFNNFLNQTLKIRERLKADLLSFDIGNVLHDIMCEYYRKKKEVGDIYEFCKNKVFKFINADSRLKSVANDLYISNLIDEAVRSIAKIDNVDRNSSFVNLYQEFDFKNKTAYKLKNIDLIGKVDRIDVCDDMFRILDYKTGSVDLSLSEIYYGNKLQLFLYSNAIGNILKKNFVGCFYVPLHNEYAREESKCDIQGYFLNDRSILTKLDNTLNENKKSSILGISLTKDGIASKTSKRVMDKNQIDDVKRYVNKVSEQAVEEIKSGFISPSPNEISKICDYCPYAKVCLKNSSNLKIRKSNSVNIDSFKEVEDE